MFEMIKEYRREFMYVTVLFVLWEIAQIPEIIGIGWLYSILIFIGGLLIIAWIMSSYSGLSKKKVSKYSNVLLKINFKERFFLYFFYPLFFYLVISYYLFENKSLLMSQFIIIISTGLMFIMFTYLRASYEKNFSIARNAKVAFKFMDIILFYVSISVLTLYGVSDIVKVVGVVLASLILLGHQLMMHKQLSSNAAIILFASVFVLAGVAVLLLSVPILQYPILISIAFYLVISWWSIRLEGISKLDEYIPPLLFSLMAYIIVVSL